MRGADAEQLKTACQRLGDVVLDPAMWPEIMEEICGSVGSIGAGLLQSDVRTPDIPRTASMAEPLERYFAGGWHRRDLRARAVPLLLRGKAVVSDADICTLEEMRRDPYFHECVYSSGLKWWAAVGFHAGSSLWLLAIQRTNEQGSFEPNDTRLLATLSNRLTEVATLSTAIGRIALSSATNALNAVRQPAVAIDRLGYVLDVNAEAEALFDDQIRVRNRRLVLADCEAQGCFEKLIDCISAAPDFAVLGLDPFVIRRNSAPAIITRALSVHSAARTPFLGARAIITLTPIENKPGPKLTLLTKAFGLTAAEAKLASFIAEGLNPERAAEELGISKATARNHLKAVFAKTGAHRQSELVAMLSRL
jgi:DNA-binding CsgD family transcriptional regulator